MTHTRHSSAPSLSVRRRHVDPRDCRALWAAVLARMIGDLCTPGAERTEGGRLRRDAERWVGPYPGQEFRRVCDCLGLEAGAVHARLSALIALPVAERYQRLGRVLDSDAPRPREQAGLTLSPSDRRDRIARLAQRGVAPAAMPTALAAEGHQVAMTTIWNDLKYLRAKGRIGQARRPEVPDARTREEREPAHA